MYPLNFYQALSISFLCIIKEVFTDYCVFGTCDENAEYCCGKNKCCEKTVDVWYYWAVVLLVVITIIIAACFYVKTMNKYKSYRKLEPQFEEVSTHT